MIRKFVLALVVVLVCNGVSHARGRRHPVANTGRAVAHTVGHIAHQTAHEAATLMAKLGHIAHFGGHHPHFEGVGMASTPEAAYNICCYANSGMKTVDSAVVQGHNGMWFACRRYQR